MLILQIILLLQASPVFAQAASDTPPIEDHHFLIQEDPESGRGLLFIMGSFDHHPHVCLLDAGSQSSMYFPLRGDPLNYYPAVGTVTSGSLAGVGSGRNDVIDVTDFQAAGNALGDVKVIRGGTEYTALMSAGVTGLVGIDALLRKSFRLSFSDSTLGFGEEFPKKWHENEFVLNGARQISISGKLSDLPIQGVWDTGASGTVVDQGLIDAHPDLFDVVEETDIQDGVGVTIHAKIYQAHDLVIGTLHFKNLKVTGVDLTAVNSHLDVKMQVLYGYNLISKADWYFDPVKKVWGAKLLKKSPFKWFKRLFHRT